MNPYLSRETLATRWGVSRKTVDRLRASGALPWVDISGGRGERPLVRFKPEDVEAFESDMRHSTPRPEQAA
jgi:hypothetical protein